MSIIIKGMDMPERGRITIQIGADGSVYSISSCNITAEKYEKHLTALDIPSHGDLIDRDELKGIVGKFPLSWEYGNGVKDCWNAILEAPTIIEAEE